MPLAPVLGKLRQANFPAFKASLVYILVKSAKATWSDPVSVKTSKQKNQNAVG